MVLLFVPRVLEAVGRKDLRNEGVLGSGAGGDSGRGSAASGNHPDAVRFPPAPPQPRANFCAWHAPMISIPAHGVIVGYLASHPHVEDFLQTLASIQGSMGICRITRRYDEALFPLRNKAGLQKVIGGGQAVDAGQTHFFYQAVLQRS